MEEGKRFNLGTAEGKAEWLAEMKEVYTRRDMLANAMQEAKALLLQAAQSAMQSGELKEAELADFVVEIPADTSHGDFASNLAMVNARTLGCAPRQIAEAVAKHVDTRFVVQRVEVAGPGFINMFLSENYFSSVVMAALFAEDYGRTDFGAGEKVNVEFVSANPTGPMHLGNARGGALGDVLAAAMDWAGYDVTREFYINDAGNQINKFGLSLEARYLQIACGDESQVPFPEDGYQGEDIRTRAQEFYELHGDAFAQKPSDELRAALVDYALPKNIQGLKDDLAKYRIHYDVWFHESELHESGAVDKAVKTLLEKDNAYEKDGAIWYRATKFGAEKDEVLVRANGVPTYFAADIAYHADKFARGAVKAIDVWGADHHGHVARMKGALDAVGLDGSKLDIVLMQFVTLVQGGQPVKMSKRTGKAITLTDLLDEVPIDSARFFFNLRDPGSQIEFDLDLAVKEDSENPVYYVQYAHARICSMLKKLAVEENTTLDEVAAIASLGLLTTPEERALVRRIAAFPGEIVGAAKSYDPARITRYVMDVATGFHKFYTACRLKGEEEGLLQARLALVQATKTVLANGLAMLKVSAPESM